MTLKIIGAGFGRTGTKSLKLALEQLGFGPCHHMEEVMTDHAQLPHWQAGRLGRRFRRIQLCSGLALGAFLAAAGRALRRRQVDPHTQGRRWLVGELCKDY